MQMIDTVDVHDPGERRFPPVVVGGQLIPEEAIAEEMQHHPAAQLDDAWHEAARSLVIRELLLQQAEELAIDPNLDEEERLAAVIDRQMDTPDPDDATCERFFAANPDRFCTPTLMAVSHILLAAAPDDVKARLEQEYTGNRLIERLHASDADFATLARRHSACESAKQDGHLGQLVRGQTVEEFERVVWPLPEGLYNKLVESRYGFHIVRVDRRMEGEPLTYEQVKPKIRQYLQEKFTRRWLRQFLQVLAAQTGVEGVDLELPDSPLMQ